MHQCFNFTQSYKTKIFVMKKLFTGYLFLTIFVFLFGVSAYAGDRIVLIEFFTSSTCGPCASNNPVMHSFMISQDPERIIAAGFHMNWPAPGNDPMFLYNQADNNARRGYYGINAIPAGQLDGNFSIPLPYNESVLLSYFNSRKDILSPVTIILTDSTISADSVLVRAKIFCETLLPSPSVTVYIVLKEKYIKYTSPPGTNGEKDFYDVMRKMLPDGSGTPVVLLPGQTKIIERKYKKDPIWQQDSMRVIAYVQDGSKEILNAGIKLPNFTLTSNPSFGSVNQGVSQTKDFTVQIPYVAAGYNSPVSFMAAVEPVTTGITTTFTSGTTISTFPGSLNLQVASTAAVPAGVYNVVLTGTSASGKVHKTQLSYLVGKNWVTVGASKPLVTIKIDGVNSSAYKAFSWDLNSTHTLQAISPLTVDLTRYVFQNWSNGGDTTQTITVNSTTSDYVANYKTQFKLQANAFPGGIPVTITGGNDFLDSASNVTVSVTPASVPFNGLIYYFQRWIGQGAGSYTGTNRTFNTVINNPITQIAYYDTINTSVNPIGTEIPAKYALYQNYPNPFNPVTSIKFDLPKAGDVRIVVYDILGKEMESMFNGFLGAGKYSVNLNATGYASGIYFYRLESNGFTDIKRMVVVK